MEKADKRFEEKYGGMVEALDCITAITVQMTSALKKQISQ